MFLKSVTDCGNIEDSQKKQKEARSLLLKFPCDSQRYIFLIPSTTLEPYLAPHCMAGSWYLHSRLYDNSVDFSEHVKKVMFSVECIDHFYQSLQEMNKGLTSQ